VAAGTNLREADILSPETKWHRRVSAAIERASCMQFALLEVCVVWSLMLVGLGLSRSGALRWGS